MRFSILGRGSTEQKPPSDKNLGAILAIFMPFLGVMRQNCMALRDIGALAWEADILESDQF